MKTYNIIAKGRVQGVGFRFFTYSIALKYGIKGSVKNLDNGSVEIYLQGDEDKINNLKKYLLKGNRFIKVESLHETIYDFNEFHDFKIRY